MRRFLEDEVQIYSNLHHASIEQADQAAWAAFAAEGIEVTRLDDADVLAFTRLAVPRWFAWAGRDPDARRLFRIQLDYMMSGTLGYVTADMLQGLQLDG
jgi:hypothetical protein